MFTINIAKGLKHKAKPRPNRISRLCWGEVIEMDNKYQIKLSLKNDPDYPDYLIIPFDAKSIDLYGKTEVYTKIDNKYVKVIRDIQRCKIFPGLATQYTVVIPGNICSGYVIRNNGKLLFDIKKIHGRGEYALREVENINKNIPLFDHEHNFSNSSKK
jgi:hypothetical protein